MRFWWFSGALLLGYVLTFQLWLMYPGRTAFLVVGALAVVVMASGMRQAARSGYFANRSDQVLHGLVIVDVALEAVSYEAFHTASMCVLCTPGDANCFHSNYNFCWCSAILAVLVGGYHWWALRREATSCDGANRSSQSPHSPTDEATEV